MTKINPKLKNLKELFNSPDIIKVFHDFWEDYAIIYHLNNIECNSIFDTQVCHRILFEQINNKKSYMTKNCNLSYCELLKEYLNIEIKLKNEMKKLMNENPYFWKKVRNFLFYI